MVLPEGLKSIYLVVFNNGGFMTKLSVNVNKIALLRNQRDLNLPDVSKCTRIIMNAGAAGITVHPRPDERHIHYADAYDLAKIVNIEYNIEGNPFTGSYMELMRDLKPTQATLVPDMPGAVTSDSGWNVAKNAERLKAVVDELKELGIRVSIFIEADEKTVADAAGIGADRVELYTEPFARAFMTGTNLEKTIEKYHLAAKAARQSSLGLNAGHDLNLLNLPTFLDRVERVDEVSIGHALISDALEMGLYNTVKEYIKVVSD